MANKNKNLNAAAKAKKDEFYTRLEDIENELRHYKKFFKDKIVLCNCDDPYESNFFQYFAMNFNVLGLKKLVATCYDGSPVAGKEINLFDTPVENPQEKKAFKVEINEVEDFNGDGAIDLLDVEFLIKKRKNVLTMLEGNGDFRSPECIELLKQADVVVTNPPFSLFREYVSQLVEYEKKFLIIGNINCITYKEIFPLLKDNKAWLGHGMGRWIGGFIVPEKYELYGTEARIDENGRRIVSSNNSLWLTNIDYEERHEDIPLFREYYKNPDAYPKYDNYDAIEVSKTADIPEDYFGVMGVPITFMDKYNPEQFEILGMAKRGAGDPSLRSKVYKKEDYPNYSDLNAGPVLNINGKLKNTYPRILIRRREK